mgnify:CR=1 FL=1|jgi:hypothetical protein
MLLCWRHLLGLMIFERWLHRTDWYTSGTLGVSTEHVSCKFYRVTSNEFFSATYRDGRVLFSDVTTIDLANKLIPDGKKSWSGYDQNG